MTAEGGTGPGPRSPRGRPPRAQPRGSGQRPTLGGAPQQEGDREEVTQKHEGNTALSFRPDPWLPGSLGVTRQRGKSGRCCWQPRPAGRIMKMTKQHPPCSPLPALPSTERTVTCSKLAGRWSPFPVSTAAPGKDRGQQAPAPHTFTQASASLRASLRPLLAVAPRPHVHRLRAQLTEARCSPLCGCLTSSRLVQDPMGHYQKVNANSN